MAHETNEHRGHFRWGGRYCALTPVLVSFLLAGCTTPRAQVAQALGSTRPAPVIREQTVEEAYHIGCPDVVEIAVGGMPEVSGEYTVSPEGRIVLTALGNPRVEGHTTAGLAACVASELGLPVEQVQCRVK